MNPQMVQLVSGRHQIRNRNGGDRQCHRARCALGGLLFPPCGVDDLPACDAAARRAGGVLEKSRGGGSGCPRWNAMAPGVPRSALGRSYVVLEAPNDLCADCFKQYGLKTDASGRYAAMYKPYHFDRARAGTFSVLSAALAQARPASRQGFRGDARVAVAQTRPARRGNCSTGEGGYTVWGQTDAAAASLGRRRAVPSGLAHRVKPVKSDVAHSAVVRWSDGRDRCR